MIRCFPPCSKCRPKYEKEHIERFLEHYNVLHKTDYRIEKYLEQESRNSPQPEALLRSQGHIDMVIENKIIVWPDTYLRSHRNHHLLSHHFLDQLCFNGNVFAGQPCQLSVRDSSLVELHQEEVHRVAYQIADAVLANTHKARNLPGIRSSKPIPWVFRPLTSGEIDDDYQGIIVNAVGDDDDWLFPEEERSGYERAFKKSADKAAHQLGAHPSCWKLLVVQFAGSILDEETEMEVIRGVTIPKTIDEIWLETEEWVSDSEWETFWKPYKCA